MCKKTHQVAKNAFLRGKCVQNTRLYIIGCVVYLGVWPALQPRSRCACIVLSSQRFHAPHLCRKTTTRFRELQYYYIFVSVFPQLILPGPALFCWYLIHALGAQCCVALNSQPCCPCTYSSVLARPKRQGAAPCRFVRRPVVFPQRRLFPRGLWFLRAFISVILSLRLQKASN